MFTDKAVIKDLVDNLIERQVTLYHACQLVDFCSYLELGGIPSREKLTSSGLKFTTFETDETDRKNEVWDKVFLNFTDFGKTFVDGHGATPNPYGPILLEINPRSLLEAYDISITLRSAGAADFNRENESISTLVEFNNLFVYSKSDENIHQRKFVKFSSQLQKDFKNLKATSPEINCRFKNSLIPSSYIRHIKVDQYDLQKTTLIKLVSELLKKYKLSIETSIRYTKTRYKLNDEIAKIISEKTPSFEGLRGIEGISKNLVIWIDQLEAANLEYQYVRYAKYLREGTLSYTIE